MGMHAVISPPVDYVPAKHGSQPSVENDAPFLVAILPALHSDLLHVKSEPPKEKVPTWQSIQPSV
jgi:hypothetical protein